MKTPCNLFALLEDNSVRKINLLQSLTTSIRSVFVEKGEALIDSKEEIEFDGNYKIDEDEIWSVPLSLPSEVADMNNSSINAQILDLKTDTIKALFWCENNEYYFQTFDKRKLLKNKNVLFFDKNTFTKLEEDAFVIENIVHAVYRNGKYYFSNYVNANRIFSLISFYNEATNEDIETFAANKKIELDEEWFKVNSNTIMRKHITMLQKTGILNNVDTKKVKSSAKQFKLKIDLDANGKIIFPKDKKICRDLLTFLNEQFYFGLITGNRYRTNSKRTADI